MKKYELFFLWTKHAEINIEITLFVIVLFSDVSSIEWSNNALSKKHTFLIRFSFMWSMIIHSAFNYLS